MKKLANDCELKSKRLLFVLGYASLCCWPWSEPSAAHAAVPQEIGRQLPPALPGATQGSNSSGSLPQLPQTLQPSIPQNDSSNRQMPGRTSGVDPDDRFRQSALGNPSNAAAGSAGSAGALGSANDGMDRSMLPRHLQARPSAGGQQNSVQLINSGKAIVPYCPVKLIQKIELSANELGALAEVAVVDGQTITKGMVVAKVNDEQARTELSLAIARRDAAMLKVDSDIEIRYAEAGYNAAAKTFERENSLYKKGVGTTAERDEARLQAIQANLQINKAQHDHSVSQKAVTVEKLQVVKAQEFLNRHSVIAPWGGIVSRVIKHQSEWVNAGDPIMEVIQMDRLWVEGKIHASEINPYQVSEREVNVTMTLAQGERISFPGKIVYVELEVVGGDYKVRAEVANRTFQNHWLLIPGMNVDMEIDILPAGSVENTAQQIDGNNLGQVPPVAGAIDPASAISQVSFTQEAPAIPRPAPTEINRTFQLQSPAGTGSGSNQTAPPSRQSMMLPNNLRPRQN